MARLGDVVAISGSTQKIDEEQTWLLNLDMVEQQTGDILSYNFVSKDKLNGSIIQFDTGNILYSKLRPNLNKVVVPNQSGFATSEMLPLRPDTSRLTREYLAAYLRSDSFVNWAISKTAGAKMPRLGTKELLNKDIPVPVIEKQIKITGILDKLSRSISLRKQQLAKLDELVKARFVEMFGDFKLNPFKWPIASFSDFAKIDGNMTTEYEKYADYPHIGIDSIEKGTGALKGYRTVKEDGVISGKYIFSSQHIIYSKIRPNLNKVALPDFDGLCSADAYPILPIEGISVGLSAFGVYYWQKRDEKRAAATLVKGQIDLIEERIHALQSDHQLGNVSVYHSKVILQENLWEKYKHLFIKSLQKSDAEIIQRFYDSAEQIEYARSSIVKLLELAQEQKSSVQIDTIGAIMKESQGQEQMWGEINKFQASFVPYDFGYVPDMISNSLVKHLNDIHMLSGTTAYQKIQNWSYDKR